MFQYFFILICFLVTVFIPAGSAKPILILQDEWGGITGINITYDINEIKPYTIRPPLSNPLTKIIDFEISNDGGCQLFGDGSLFPVGKAHLFSGSFQNDQAVGLALLPNENGGWTATSKYLKPVGYTPNLALPSFQYPIRDIEFDAHRNRLCILLSNGDIAYCTQKSFEWMNVLNFKRDEALDFEFRSGEIFVLTKTGNVYRFSDRIDSQSPPLLVEGIQESEKYDYIDLELLPHTGLLLLDKNGLIHSFDGAPRIPALPISVVDIELMDAVSNPLWFPQGWKTSVSFNPDTIKLDPLGPEKKIQLLINNAENVASFSTEILYDPNMIRLNQEVQPGRWWKQSMNYPNLTSKTYPDRNGLLSILGSGSVFPYQGANGSGELVELTLSVAEGVHFGTTTLQIQEFSFQNASPVTPRINAEVISNVTIQIAVSEPKLSLAWVVDDTPISETKLALEKSEICRADILVSEGSRIKECQFNISYSTNNLRFLGMSKGNVWNIHEPVETQFPLPSKLKQNGKLNDIVMSAIHVGACKDEPGSLLSILFQVTNPNKIEENGLIQLDSVQFTDNNHQNFVAETGNLKLYLY